MKLGFGPITWNNEDLPAELGEPVPYTTVLDEVAAAGYTATELGDGFPRDPTLLRAELEARGLAMPSAWCALRPLEVSANADLEATRALCALLSGVGAAFVNLADHGTPESMAMAGRVDGVRLSASEWDRFAERVVQAADVAREFGLQPLFHAHAGTRVESRAELEEFLWRLPASTVKLVWDVGHAIYGGIDPIGVVRSHPERIAYIHLKDVDPGVLDRLRRERLGFTDGIRQRVFTELGHGCLDVPGLIAALREVGYDGWLMVEQDSTWLPPVESASASREYLRGLLTSTL
jgi:inosose dehydratase